MLSVFDCSFLLCVIFVLCVLVCDSTAFNKVIVGVLVRGKSSSACLQQRKNIIITVSIWGRQRCREPGAIGQDLGGGFECVPQRALAHSLEMAACIAIFCCCHILCRQEGKQIVHFIIVGMSDVQRSMDSDV